MSPTLSQQPPATVGDKRRGSDRRENAERRQTMMDLPGTERRHADDRRSWVGRRQAAEWRRQ